MTNFLIFFLILPTEFLWMESFINNDTLWLENALNWEEAVDLTFNELSLYSFFTTPFFNNIYFFADFMTKLSFIDILFLIETSKTSFSKEFFDLFIWDLVQFLQSKLPFLQYLFYSDFQDFIILILYYSPELVLAVNDYVNAYWIKNILHYTPSIVYDFFKDSLNVAISEFIEHLALFFFFAWIIVFSINLFHITRWNNPLEIYFAKLFNYLYTIAKETRVQFEAFLQTFFFFFFYWTMLVATFDDDKEELIEIFDTSLFYFFCLIIFYLIFKYSQHYFAFLEASVSEGRSVSYITKQFFRDFINTFALFLRFFILLFRLNVYDTLDDFYDSYYVYVGDFDEDEYFSELFFSYYSLMSFEYDNNTDSLFSLENENEFFLDFFYIYFVCWGKLFYFIFFILEEILRISLAFYICYLIIFEVHSVNCSYLEDTSFSNFKTFYDKKSSNVTLLKI